MWLLVSGNPPLLEVIVAQPHDVASKATLPKGSFHLEGTTAISDLSSILKVFLWFKKFKYNKKFPWTTNYSSKRFINLVYNYDFICSISSKKEIAKIDRILNFHITRIIFEIGIKKPDDISSSDILALVLIECCKLL